MAERIKVSTEEIQNTIGQYESAKEAKLESVARMQSAVESAEWEGEAAQSFKAKFGELYQNLMSSEAVIDDAVNELKVAIQTYEAAETANTTVGESIEVGFHGLNT